MILLNKRLYEINKIDTPLPAAALVAATAQTSRAYELSDYRKALFSVRLRNIASTDTDLEFEVLEASDIAATTAQNVGDLDTTPSIDFERVAAGCIANANAVELTLVTPANDDVVTINGVEFTAHTDTTDLDANQFAIDGTDTEDAAELVLCINNALPNLIATNTAGAVLVQSREPGEETITVTGINDITNIVPVTVEVVGNIEVDVSALSDGFGRVCGRITPGATAAAITCDISLVRGNARYVPAGQQEGGSAFAPVIT